ncbi:MAG: aromatic ring-hydroxylating dioxygenase subunit alpha [Actinocatenispora sp.]
MTDQTGEPVEGRPLGTPALPAECYTDPDFYAREQRHVFDSGWLPLCRLSDAPAEPGFVPVSAGGRDLLLTRDSGGDLRLLVNACSHRGMTLTEEPVPGGRVECLYHKWTYGPDGALRSAPLVAPTLDRAACALPRVRWEVWLGWIFVNLSGTAEPLTPQLTGLAAELDGWRIDEMVTAASIEFDSPWNWKVMWENFNEYYHHLGTHRYSLEPLLPARTARCADNAGQPWSLTSMPCDEDYLDMQAFMDQESAPTSDMHLFSVFPLLCAGVQPGSAFWLQILPGTVDRHRVIWHLLLPPSVPHEPGYQQRLEVTMNGLEQIHIQDMETCRLVQRGLANRHGHGSVLTSYELPIAQLHEWIIGRMPADGAR